jgi:hypothetical protein
MSTPRSIYLIFGVTLGIETLEYVKQVTVTIL